MRGSRFYSGHRPSLTRRHGHPLARAFGRGIDLSELFSRLVDAFVLPKLRRPL